MTDPLAIDWINSSEIVVTRAGAAVVKVGQAYAGTTPVAAAVVVETTRPTKPVFGQSISVQIGPPQIVSVWNRTTVAWVQITAAARAAYASDAAAGAAGLVTGDIWQTTAGHSLGAAGVMMVKQ